MKVLNCSNCLSCRNGKCEITNERMFPLEYCNDHSSNICEEEIYDNIVADYYQSEYASSKKSYERYDFIGNA